MFWTLGGNQVGKAAICGWQEVVQPARRAGALLWPFEGALPSLAGAGTLVIFMRPIRRRLMGTSVSSFAAGPASRTRLIGASSVRHSSRCREHGVQLADAMYDAINDGFGPRKSGEDPFDAAMGLLV